MFNDVNDLVGIAEVAGVIVMSILYIKSRLPKETIENQGKLIAALQNRLEESIRENKDNLEKYREAEKIMAEKHLQNEKAIADLQGQIKVYKELPLQDIAKSLKALEGIPHEFEKVTENSTKKILEAITNVKTQHVTHQTVDTETVNHKN